MLEPHNRSSCVRKLPGSLSECRINRSISFRKKELHALRKKTGRFDCIMQRFSIMFGRFGGCLVLAINIEWRVFLQQHYHHWCLMSYCSHLCYVWPSWPVQSERFSAVVACCEEIQVVWCDCVMILDTFVYFAILLLRCYKLIIIEII